MVVVENSPTSSRGEIGDSRRGAVLRRAFSSIMIECNKVEAYDSHYSESTTGNSGIFHVVLARVTEARSVPVIASKCRKRREEAAAAKP